MRTVIPLLILVFLHCSELSRSEVPPPPLPVLPVPTASQLKWQRREMIMFYHFGVSTFTDFGWANGYECPNYFNPPNLNASQWIEVAETVGVTLVILTAKHHDGFCLWPTRYTNHSVALSPWLGGKGDVVRELVTAASARGIDVGIYLSPWDRHQTFYGQDVPYNEYYMGQLRELLTNYGSISEIWLDSRKGEWAPNMTYYLEEWFGTAKQLQPSINVFSDVGPDLRWVGNEMGVAGETSWSLINRTRLVFHDDYRMYLLTGDPRGTDWVPPECDVTIRPNWFWYKDRRPMPLSELIDIYYTSVGRNCVLLLNVPPNKTGIISDVDIHRLREFRSAIDTIFKDDIARGSTVTAKSQRGGEHGPFRAGSVVDGDEETYWAPAEIEKDGSYWIELSGLNRTTKFNVVRIQEAIQLGQRIQRHEVLVDGKVVVANGTTVGYKRLHRLEQPEVAARVSIRILESRGPPLLSAIGLHFDPFKPWVEPASNLGS